MANLIRVPFKNNVNFSVGPEDVTPYILNVQPVIPISLNEDWNLITRTIIPIITANWQESAKEAWVIPVGGGLGRIVRIGKLPPNCHLGACWNVCTPTDGPDWQLRAQIQVMFPK